MFAFIPPIFKITKARTIIFSKNWFNCNWIIEIILILFVRNFISCFISEYFFKKLDFKTWFLSLLALSVECFAFIYFFYSRSDLRFDVKQYARTHLLFDQHYFELIYFPLLFFALISKNAPTKNWIFARNEKKIFSRNFWTPVFLEIEKCSQWKISQESWDVADRICEFMPVNTRTQGIKVTNAKT